MASLTEPTTPSSFRTAALAPSPSLLHLPSPPPPDLTPPLAAASPCCALKWQGTNATTTRIHNKSQGGTLMTLQLPL